MWTNINGLTSVDGRQWTSICGRMSVDETATDVERIRDGRRMEWE
jgi:hypothetical protein